MNILCSRIRNLEQWVYYGIKFGNGQNDWNLLKTRESSKIPTHRAVLAVPTFHIELLFPRVPKSPAASPECTEIHKDMSIPGSVFDCQPARRVPHELHSDSRNLASSSGIQRREGIEKSGSEEPLQRIHLPCFSGKAEEKVWTTEIVLSLRLTMPRVSGVVLKVACNGISELDCELQNRGLLVGKESHTRVAVDQGNRSSQIAGWPHHSKVNNGQRFPWLRRVGFDDGVSIEKVLR